jgi:hypothetical protein
VGEIEEVRSQIAEVKLVKHGGRRENAEVLRSAEDDGRKIRGLATCTICGASVS